MQVIRYSPKDFIPKVALIVGIDSNAMLVGGKIVYTNQDKLATYKSVVLESVQSNNEFSADYDIFTVDIFCFRSIYAQISNKCIEVFRSWQEIIDYLLSTAINDSILAEMQKMTCYSPIYDVVVDVEAVAKNYNISSGMTSARFVNIAIKKSETDGKAILFYEQLSRQISYCTYKVATEMVQKPIYVHEQCIYNQSDFSIVKEGIGQRIRVAKNATLTLYMQDFLQLNRQMLVHNGTIKDVKLLEQYCTVVDYDDYSEIRFVYNPNRQYVLRTDANKQNYDIVKPGDAMIFGNDMLEHAKQLGIVFNDKYIDASLVVNGTVLLHNVVMQKLLSPITIKHWYEDIDWYNKTFNRLPVVTWSTLPNLQYNYVIQPNYGNLQHVIIEGNANSESCKDFVTAGSIRTKIDAIAATLNLPSIYNGKCKFRGIDIEIVPLANSMLYANIEKLNDMQFMIVLAETTAPYTVMSDKVIAIVLPANLSKYMSNGTVRSNLTEDELYQYAGNDMLLAKIISEVDNLTIATMKFKATKSFTSGNVYPATVI